MVDENNAAVPGAQVFLTRAGSEFRLESVADPTGRFVFRADSPGEYLLTAERPGFFRLQDRPVRLAEGANEVTLVLNPTREVFEKVDVSYSPPAIDFDRTTPEERVTGTELLQVPYPSTNTLRNALRTIPGVVQDSAGGIHLNGGGEQQILYTLDGFQINDPLTGRFESRVGVEAVRSTEVSGLNPAEFGKGAAGTAGDQDGDRRRPVPLLGNEFHPRAGEPQGLGDRRMDAPLRILGTAAARPRVVLRQRGCAIRPEAWSKNSPMGRIAAPVGG